MPLAAILAAARSTARPTPRSGHYTHEKSPVASAAALATLAAIEDEGLIDRARDLEAHGLARSLPCRRSARASSRSAASAPISAS